MGLGDFIKQGVTKTLQTVPTAAAGDFKSFLNRAVQSGDPKQSMSAKMVESVILKSQTATGGMIGINDFGFKGKRQYIADRRYLLDLYVIALNNADIRTATTHLRNEIFRRGLDIEPKFDFHCDGCGREYSLIEAKQHKGICPDCQYARDSEGNLIDEDGKTINVYQKPDGSMVGDKQPIPAQMRRPDDSQTKILERFIKNANYFGQSLENVLREAEDDLNVVDDAFLYCRKKYVLTEEEEVKLSRGEKVKIEEQLMHLFRLDPVLVEFDLDYKGVPGMRHHICVFHRDNLLEVEPDMGWEVNWQGKCPECGCDTRPIYFKYNEQYLMGGYGSAQTKVLYLTEDELIHWSRYTPTETYGYPPLLTIYEQALTLIGMNRYLYDYFYERKVPQGVVTVVTDNVEGFNATKAEVESRMQQDPHYIPWMAISSRSGQGKMEFVRFAYSLDELNYLPVRDEIRERISGLYGVSSIWMSSMQGTGGLNNETQQLTVMSRVVEGAQRSYQTDVFPKLLSAMGVTDWTFKINTPEETTELAEEQLFGQRAQSALTMSQIGFGIDYDPDAKTFTYSGKIKSLEEQQQQQTQMAQAPVAAGANPQQQQAEQPARPQIPNPPGMGIQNETKKEPIKDHDDMPKAVD